MPATSTLQLFTFRIGPRKFDVRASSPNAAASRLVEMHGYPPNCCTVSALLHYLVDHGWCASILDERGLTVGECDPVARSVVVYPPLD